MESFWSPQRYSDLEFDETAVNQSPVSPTYLQAVQSTFYWSILRSKLSYLKSCRRIVPIWLVSCKVLSWSFCNSATRSRMQRWSSSASHCGMKSNSSCALFSPARFSNDRQQEMVFQIAAHVIPLKKKPYNSDNDNNDWFCIVDLLLWRMASWARTSYHRNAVSTSFLSLWKRAAIPSTLAMISPTASLVSTWNGILKEEFCLIKCGRVNQTNSTCLIFYQWFPTWLY